MICKKLLSRFYPLALFTFLSIAAIIALTDSVCQAVTEIPALSVIKKDTVWQGDLLLKGDVRVEPGATLVIMPGSKISFAKIAEFGNEKLSKDKNDHFPRAELVIRGRLIAQGLPEKPIVFTSAEQNPSVADWGAVNFIGSRDNVMEFCQLSYGHTSIHCHSAQVVISHCTFHHNGVAIGQKNVKTLKIKSSVPMLYNIITENGGGILFGGGTSPVIFHNEISNNKFFGIYAKKSGKASIRYNNITRNGKGIILYAVKDIIIRENNISDNLDYNISLLEGQTKSIHAEYNWWGTTTPKAISSTIRDRHRDQELGALYFDNAASGPVQGAGLI